MAEEIEEANVQSQVSGGSWWDSLVNTAKTKSVEVLEFMKKDFDEFSSVVKTEAASLANQTASAVKETLQLEDEKSTANTVKRSVSSFFGSVKEALSPSPSSDLDEAILIKDGSPVSLSRLQTKIYSLSKEDSTYLDDIPSGEKKQFEAWLSVSEDLLSSVSRLSIMLESNQILQEKYTTLVLGNKIEDTKFWERFLFRKALLEDGEAELQRRMEREKAQSDIVLGQDERLVNDLDLTEEEQMKILADYDEEQKKKKDSSVSPKSSSTQLSDVCPEEKEPLKVKEKNGLVIVSNVSSHTSTSSSKASTDGDWEKDFYFEDGETIEGK